MMQWLGAHRPTLRVRCPAVCHLRGGPHHRGPQAPSRGVMSGMRPPVLARVVLTTVPHGSTQLMVFFFTLFSHTHASCQLSISLCNSHPWLFSYTVADLRLFHSLSIQTRRCSRILSHFCSSFTHTAFSHAAVLAYDRIFAALSLSIPAHRCSRIRSHFRSLAAFSYAAVLA